MQAQQHEIDMIATAVEEMSASISEVARSAAQGEGATPAGIEARLRHFVPQVQSVEAV